MPHIKKIKENQNYTAQIVRSWERVKLLKQWKREKKITFALDS